MDWKLCNPNKSVTFNFKQKKDLRTISTLICLNTSSRVGEGYIFTFDEQKYNPNFTLVQSVYIRSVCCTIVKLKFLADNISFLIFGPIIII